MDRLSGRRVCKSCGGTYHVSNMKGSICQNCGGELIQRDDDAPETVQNRLRVYGEQTQPLIDYRQQGVLVTVDGTQGIDEGLRRHLRGAGEGIQSMIKLKTPDQIARMREACQIAAGAGELAGRSVAVGMTTRELDAIVNDYILKHGAKPSFYKYDGFPGHVHLGQRRSGCMASRGSRHPGRRSGVGGPRRVHEKGFHSDTGRYVPRGPCDR